MLNRPTKHRLARELTDGLMDYRARQIAWHAEESARLQRLTSLAQVLEASVRADGNPERIAAVLGLDDQIVAD